MECLLSLLSFRAKRGISRPYHSEREEKRKPLDPCTFPFGQPCERSRARESRVFPFHAGFRPHGRRGEEERGGFAPRVRRGPSTTLRTGLCAPVPRLWKTTPSIPLVRGTAEPLSPEQRTGSKPCPPDKGGRGVQLRCRDRGAATPGGGRLVFAFLVMPGLIGHPGAFPLFCKDGNFFRRGKSWGGRGIRLHSTRFLRQAQLNR